MNVRWSVESVDAEFDRLKEELNRVPSYDEFRRETRGAINHIRRGKYNPKIRTFRDYISHRGFEMTTRRWSGESIDEAFDQQTRRLGRIPTYSEFLDENGGAIHFISRGLYKRGIKSYAGYLRHRGVGREAVAERVDAAFDALRKSLSHIPAKKDVLGWILETIQSGKYDADIRTYKAYLRHRGFTVETRVDEAFDSLIKRLGRIPTVSELKVRNSWMLHAIESGSYSPELRTYNGYLGHRGFQPNREQPNREPAPSSRDLEDILDKFGRQEI